jgi:EAL domain-containing protein (putative c-di-GMP-specific phosphodiesterase class I)
LHRAGVPAAALTLEVTENGVMASSGRVRQVLDDLRSMGVQLSIDDFGSGSTSLSYLGRLPLNELKIDKSFVIGLGDPVNHAIVRSTIELGHNLGMQVVAEGVETLDVWQELQMLGCDVLQGFVIARPLTELAMTSSLATPRAVAPTSYRARPPKVAQVALGDLSALPAFPANQH